MEAIEAESGSSARPVDVCPAHPGAPLVPAITGASDRIFGFEGRFDYYACTECGSWVLSPRPAPEALGRFYSGYHTDGHLAQTRRRFARRRPAVAGSFNHARAKTYLRELEKLGADLQPSMRFLDIGCGLGAFPRFVRDLSGADCKGVDFSPKCRAFAAEIHDLAVASGDLAAQAYPDRAFDRITALHVLEHTYDPLAELREMYRILEPGGWLMLEVPTNDIAARLFRGRWVSLAPPTHFFHFRPEALRLLVQRAGFEVVRESRPWFPTELAASVVLAGGVRRFNPALSGEDGILPRRVLLAWMLVQLVYDLPLTMMIAAAGRSGILRLHARKPVETR